MPVVPRVGVIITAAGTSRRFGVDKLSARLGERSVLAWSIEAFVNHPAVVQVVIAHAPDLRPESALGMEVDALRKRHGNVPCSFVAAGGASRAETVRAALRMFGDEVEWVAVHDGARPLVSRALIDRVFAAAFGSGAAAPAMPVTSTIKLAGPTLPTSVERTLPRATLWAMQTPPVMRRGDAVEAFANCPLPLGQVTDDAQLLEIAGVPVMLIEGEERNLKITTPLDLMVANLCLK